MKRIICMTLTAIMTIASCTFAFAETTPVLTVKAATDKAIQNSQTIKNITSNTIMNEDSREDLLDTIKITTNYSTLMKSYVSLMQNDLKATSYAASDAAERQKLEHSVTKFFATVIAAENDLALYESSLKTEAKSLEISKVKAKLGQITALDLETAQKSYDQKLREISNKGIAIDSAYRSLNELMGSNKSNRYTLSLNFDYAPMPAVNLPQYTTNAQYGHPDVISKANDVAVAEYQLATYSKDAYGETEYSYEVKLGQARRAYDDQLSTVGNKVTDAYNELIKLEAQYETNQEELEKMNKQLVILEAKLSLGRATSLEVEKYKQQIAELQEKIRAQVIDHEIKMIAFNNPVLL